MMSLTGRDVIWEISIGEWLKSPIFGYGLSFLGPEHRAQLGMWWITSGHNQFIDCLGRSGLIGLSGTIFYLLTLTYLAIKSAKQSYGISLALVIFILIRTISEVPITLSALGIDATAHYLLLAAISCAFIDQSRRAAK